MKIDMITFSVNEKNEYTRFWNPISKFLKTKLNVDSAVLYTGKEDINLSEEYGDVHKIYCGDDIPTYLSSIWGYFWISSLYPDKTCMTSGIDMCILDLDYFNKQIESFDDSSYVVMNADGYNPVSNFKNGTSTVPSYYHVAKGQTFKNILQFESDFVDEINKFNSLDYSNRYNGYSDNTSSFLKETSVENGGKWCLDEMYSSDMIRDYKNKESIKLLSMSNSGNVDYHFHKPYPPEEALEETINNLLQHV